MSPSLPTISGHVAVSVLTIIGFVEVSQRGSHMKLRDAEGKTALVPVHREPARGTLRSILRQAGLTVAAFIELL